MSEHTSHASEDRDYVLEGYKDESWAKQRPLFNKIAARGGIKAYAESLAPAQLARAFEPVPPHLVCCDEGTATQGAFRSPGQLILVTDPTLLDHIMKEMIARGLQGIYSHDGCGAAAAAFGDLSAAEKAKYRNNPDHYGAARTRELAERYGLQYGHLSGSEMQRPMREHDTYHDAGVIYVGAVGDVRKAGLPNGFVVDARGDGSETTFTDTQLLAGIAMGHHGFGDRLVPAR